MLHGVLRRAGDKSRSLVARFGVWFGALALGSVAAIACTTPSVAARAVWIGYQPAADGSYSIYSYNAGEITTSQLRPLVADEVVSEASVQLELEPRGRGVFVRAVDDGWLHELGEVAGQTAGYVDLEHSRVLTFQIPGGGIAQSWPSFTRSGDAMLWFDSCAESLTVLPLAPEISDDLPDTSVLHWQIGQAQPTGRPLRATQACKPSPVRHGVATAGDAPVVYAISLAPTVAAVPAKAAAIDAIEIPVATTTPPTLRLRGRITLPPEHEPVRLSSAQCAPGDPSCGLAVVDPDGEAVSIGVYAAGCRLLRWDAREDQVLCAIPDDAPTALYPSRLIAAISPDHYVFRDGMVLHRYNWRTAELTSRPVPGTTATAFVRLSQDGRSVTMGTTQGSLARIDSESIEILNVAQHDCNFPQSPWVAPTGRFAGWTCVIDNQILTVADLDQARFAEVVRVSAGGMERFTGVPMWVLAIDDNGDMLLHSRFDAGYNAELGIPGSPPRNLYVLTATGELARVDNLKNPPRRSLGLGYRAYRWIASRAY